MNASELKPFVSILDEQGKCYLQPGDKIVIDRPCLGFFSMLGASNSPKPSDEITIKEVRQISGARGCIDWEPHSSNPIGMSSDLYKVYEMVRYGIAHIVMMGRK